MIFKTNDPLNRNVVLKRSTWEDKIINLYGNNNDNIHGNTHIEMKNRLDDVKSSVENPIYIVKDIGIKINDCGEDIEYINDTREEFYTFKFDDSNVLNAIKTVVDFSNDPNEGIIVTTHVITGSIKKIKSKGGVVYDATCK